MRAEADPDANIIVGATFDDELDGSIRVSVVATGHRHARCRPVRAKGRESLSQRLAGLASVPAPARRSLRERQCRSARSSSAVELDEPSLSARRAEAPNDAPSVARAGQRDDRDARPPQLAASALPRMAQPTDAPQVPSGAVSFRRRRQWRSARCGACRASRSCRCRCRTRSRPRRRRSRSGLARAEEEGRIPRAPDRCCPVIARTKPTPRAGEARAGIRSPRRSR